jgi:hypothetical protein
MEEKQSTEKVGSPQPFHRCQLKSFVIDPSIFQRLREFRFSLSKRAVTPSLTISALFETSLGKK